MRSYEPSALHISLSKNSVTKSKSDTKSFIIQNLLCTSKVNTCNIYLYRLSNVRLIYLILCSKTLDYSRISTIIPHIESEFVVSGPLLKTKVHILWKTVLLWTTCGKQDIDATTHAHASSKISDPFIVF